MVMNRWTGLAPWEFRCSSPFLVEDRVTESTEGVDRMLCSDEIRPIARLRFRGGLVFKAHRLLHHSTLGLRVIKKKKKKYSPPGWGG